MAPLDDLISALKAKAIRHRIRDGLIGEGAQIYGPFGARSLISADYVASGRALMQVEDVIRDRVLPFYACTHTQASFCDDYMIRLREAARAQIPRLTGAAEDMSVVFTCAGSTAGINRIAGLLDLRGLAAEGRRTVVLTGPYEHHSNILPWRETGASGIAVIRESIARRAVPILPGGGTVSFVSPWGHVYSGGLAAREEGGTANVIGDMRAALAILIKEALGQKWLDARHAALRDRALRVWRGNDRIELLGKTEAAALPIFSFRVRDGRGGYMHHQLFTRLLSDVHGVQARGGCACAGPYGHRLLGLGRADSDATIAKLERGEETAKPGWVRLNFSALLTDAKAEVILQAVDELARVAPDYENRYHADAGTARFNAIPTREEPVA